MMAQAADNSASSQHERTAADKALSWYGWGSPVGLSILLVAAATSAVLIRYAILGSF